MSLEGDEKFCLRWNDFESNIKTAFKELKDDQDFFDVTLAFAGEKQVKAHKVILSACSPFFRSVLRSNPHHHPLLYLKGVDYQEVLAVLAFMYYGEVNVSQDNLAAFLSVAEELQVKGLTQENNAASNFKATAENRIENIDAQERDSESPKIIESNIYQDQSAKSIKTEESVMIACDPVTESTSSLMIESEDFQDDSTYYDQEYGDSNHYGQYGTDLLQNEGTKSFLFEIFNFET